MQDGLCQRVELYLRKARREFANIQVQGGSGVIRLTGQLPTFHLRQLALECSKRVAGVRNVIDDLYVPERPASEFAARQIVVAS